VVELFEYFYKGKVLILRGENSLHTDHLEEAYVSSSGEEYR
jgi:hypothetical protein